MTTPYFVDIKNVLDENSENCTLGSQLLTSREDHLNFNRTDFVRRLNLVFITGFWFTPCVQFGTKMKLPKTRVLERLKSKMKR